VSKSAKLYAVEVIGVYSKEKPHLGKLLAVLKSEHDSEVKSLQEKLKIAKEALEKCDYGAFKEIVREALKQIESGE
jgi:hypothetical protein